MGHVPCSSEFEMTHITPHDWNYSCSSWTFQWVPQMTNNVIMYTEHNKLLPIQYISLATFAYIISLSNHTDSHTACQVIGISMRQSLLNSTMLSTVPLHTYILGTVESGMLSYLRNPF